MMDIELKKELNKWLIAFVNNTVLFTLTFFIVYIVYNLSIGAVAKLFGVNVLFSNYTIAANSSKSDISSVVLIFLSGPVSLAILGIVFYTLFTKMKRKKGIMKIFFLWGYLNAFNMLLGFFVIGILTESGFGEITWRFSDVTKILLMFLSLLIIVLIGNTNSKYFFTTTFSKTFIENRRKRLMFIILEVILPFIIGSLLFILVNFSEGSFYQRAVLLTMLLMLMPSLRDKTNHKHIRIIKESNTPSVVWGWFIVLAVLVVMYKIAWNYVVTI
ncbi:MAG: hypothetical protein HY840_01160 [Bacteroidetes bacterium]|nr:hypothetical protein [Bacteroidota bacterium]